jgi:hypothetical protein
VEKNKLKTKQNTGALVLRKEILRRLEESELQGVAGAARVWRPGYAEDTTPIYIYDDQP